VPPLKVPNEYGSNLVMIYGALPEHISIDAFGTFLEETGLDCQQVLGMAECLGLEVVDEWKRKYEYKKPLYNPSKLNELGTQMYNVHQWYMQAYELGHSDWIGVRV
jgi:hypothetical protein